MMFKLFCCRLRSLNQKYQTSYPKEDILLAAVVLNSLSPESQTLSVEEERRVVYVL